MTCGQFLLPEEKDEHSQHETKSSIDDDTIKKPSRLFKPLDNNKTYAVSLVLFVSRKMQLNYD